MDSAAQRQAAQKDSDQTEPGRIVRIAGPVVVVLGLPRVCLFDVVQVGPVGLIGEVIQLAGERAVVQVYEDTSGLRVGDPVWNTGRPLTVKLGPGLLGSVYDGLQRPLYDANGQAPSFLARGAGYLAPLPVEKRWEFTPMVNPGDLVREGDVLGRVGETAVFQHPILVPPGIHGEIQKMRAGDFNIKQTIAWLTDGSTIHELTLAQEWPVRRPRPFLRKIAPNAPLISGTRVIDTFFPVAKGGTAIIPGGFGTGKTITQQSLARWADTDVVVYVGCGERGNEMAEVLEEFPQLDDPRYGRPLLERTVLIANTSNMPVAAREASIYTGVTIAEYYRDLGCDVLLLADSTSRWGEALREISGRLEEMPGEEGYPAYLASRLAEFYERSGRVACLGASERDADAARNGSVTIIGAVSPPGGDFSEPITQNSLRVTGAFWGLDYALSRRRHFPAINWTRSYTLYNLDAWYAEAIQADWRGLTAAAMHLLQQEVELEEIVQLVGPDALAQEQKAVLLVTRLLREDFLQQSAFDVVDRYCPLQKGMLMLRIILTFHDRLMAALAAGEELAVLGESALLGEIARMKNIPAPEAERMLADLLDRVIDDPLV